MYACSIQVNMKVNQSFYEVLLCKRNLIFTSNFDAEPCLLLIFIFIPFMFVPIVLNCQFFFKFSIPIYNVLISLILLSNNLLFFFS